MKKIMVTGADGLLGSNLVRELLKRDYTVKALVQPGRRTRTLEGLDIEFHYGDLLDRAAVHKAMEGCDAVIHAAASTAVWPTRSAGVYKINVDGTWNIVEAAKANRVKRLVYVGSASSFGFGTKSKPGTEMNSFKSYRYGLDYINSKYEAQCVVLDAVKAGVPALVVNPTFMFGAYDSAPSSGAMIQALYRRRLPGHTSGGRNYICVRDVATGIANALTMGQPGECYILGNENLTYAEAFKKISHVVNVPAPARKLPNLAMKIFGVVAGAVARVTSTKPILSYPLARIACDKQYYSASKAVKELSLPQTPIEVGMRESFEWLKANKYLDEMPTAPRAPLFNTNRFVTKIAVLIRYSRRRSMM